MVRVELEKVEALELLAMTLAHLNDAESRGEKGAILLQVVIDATSNGATANHA